MLRRAAIGGRFTNDETLDGLEQKIDAGNPDLAIALSRYDQAQQAANEAASAQYPEVDIDGSATQNRQSDQRPLRERALDQISTLMICYMVRFPMNSTFGDRSATRLSRARPEAQASAADAASIRLSLEAQLADAYFSLRGLDARHSF